MDINILRNRYYSALLLVSCKEDILNSLPQPEFQSFFPIIDGLIEKIESEINEIQLLINDETLDKEDRLSLKKDLELLCFKKEVCESRKQEALNSVYVEQNALELGVKKNIIFATSKSGNVFIENDLKDISEEYLGSIVDCLERLLERIEEENVVKGHKMGSNHSKLSGIHEIKEFKVRVYYKILDNDLFYVIMARMKKDDFSRRDREEPVERIKNTSKEFKLLQKEILDENRKRELIEENLVVLERIREYVSENKRGNK